MSIKPHILRSIANAELEKIFPGQARDPREELVTSVVRQWTTYDGNAGIFTIPIHYYLTVQQRTGKVLAGTEVMPGTLKQILAKWGVVERDLPRVVWDLSIAQMALLVNNEGITVRVTSDPRDHTFRFEEVRDADD